MFTGHGHYSRTEQDRILELSPGQSMLSKVLLQGVAKRTVILDCCLQCHEGLLLERPEVSKYAKAAQRRVPDSAKCRSAFDRGITLSASKIVITTSCSIGEISYDNDATGGVYNSNLINTALDWANSEADSYSIGASSLSIVNAHETAAARTRKSRTDQNPTIEKAKTTPYFPFAVFA